MLNVIVDRSLVDDTMYGSLSGNCLSKHHMVLRAELVSVARLTVDVQTFRDWRLDRAMKACTPRAVNGPFQSTEGLLNVQLKPFQTHQIRGESRIHSSSQIRRC